MSRTSFERSIALVFLLALTGAAPKEPARNAPRVTVGEVTARVVGADAATERLLRRLVSEEVLRLRLAGAVRPDAYVLSASLVRLEAQQTSDGARVTSVVSAILRREESGAILAVLQGRGRAEAGRDEVSDARARALEAAVRGAVRRVPEAL